MIIRSEQMRLLAEAHYEQVCCSWTSQLRTTFPDLVKGISDKDILQAIRQDVEDAEKLEIEPELQVWRYVCLRYRMHRLRDSALYIGVIGRTLGRLDWSAEKRLDFIEQHVLSRQVPADNADER